MYSGILLQDFVAGKRWIVKMLWAGERKYEMQKKWSTQNVVRIHLFKQRGDVFKTYTSVINTKCNNIQRQWLRKNEKTNL